MNPPASKRYRDISLQESAATTPRFSDSPLRILQMVDKRLDNHKEEMNNSLQQQLRELFEESEKRLLDKLEKRLCERLDKMRIDLDDISERVTKLETQLQKHTTSTEINLRELKTSIEVNSIDTVSGSDNMVKTEIEDLKRKFLQQENNAVACDLRIDGIPFYENENIQAIFCSICSGLNIAVPNVRAIYRLRTKNAVLTPTILVKFLSPYEKNFVLNSAKNYRRINRDLLRLKLVNFDSDKPFFINENLSPTNYKIFNKAMKLKKEKLVHSVFSVRGIVYIIKEESEKSQRIESLDDLNYLFRGNTGGTNL